MSEETRGHSINRRRNFLGIKSLREFSERTGVDRQAISKAEAGVGTKQTYERLEAWLDRLEEEMGQDDGEAAPQSSVSDDLVTFHMSGDFGVEVTVKGPLSPELESMVTRLFRELRERGRDQ